MYSSHSETVINNPGLALSQCHALTHGSPLPSYAGETANGKFFDTAVATMAAIVANAEVGVDYYSQVNFIR